jgi:hypothetical protein
MVEDLIPKFGRERADIVQVEFEGMTSFGRTSDAVASVLRWKGHCVKSC